MRKWLVIALVCFATCLKAQEVEKAALLPDTTFSLPPMTYCGTIATFPYIGSTFASLGNWELHPGLNASFSAAAIFGLGSHASSGFSNSAAVMYAGQLMPKLSFSIGGYSSFLDYGRHQMRDAGLTAMLNYRFDEHWEAGIFAQKSMMHPRMPLQNMWWLGDDFGDKIGATVKYNVNLNFSFQLSVWNQRNSFDNRW
ncbi:hypothetical protein [Prevotella sp. MA2016]|uniref:hypothetical protein n=1 Tax=Prevotella sp. MA2016 TaxID=1408310 RepID=UPI000686E63C|nr:hypothetical protein [Prevotella sp. MA2016]